ncbi:MAG: ribosome silencing factor [Planctomycetota bacterium]|nr:ribosome silencing factor [Planctomycetota bacterium]
MSSTTTNKNDRAQARTFAIEAARLLHDRHCEEIIILDVTGLSHVCDYVLIGSGTSDRQMKSLAGELEDLAEENGEHVFRSNRDTGVTWIVIDFVDVVAHLFEPNQRSFYDLEQLWSDAPRIAWERNGADSSISSVSEKPNSSDGDAHSGGGG